ncbi:unnamed protein product [Diatraea saccharalis]|uniref:Uncharacterized protein n=1 Tax=Diatraea saccharalis TaxID=40085 RepID=A0A9N9N1T2_9NEOP|nr:unnamed protein product [Diatraea saccharalis]
MASSKTVAFIALVVLVQITYCQGVHREVRSPSSKLARIHALIGNSNKESPEIYFPDVEYPSNILDLIEPYYYKTSGSITEAFPKEVKEIFKSMESKKLTSVLNTSNKAAEINSLPVHFNQKEDKVEAKNKFFTQNNISQEISIDSFVEDAGSDNYKDSISSQEINVKRMPLNTTSEISANEE